MEAKGQQDPATSTDKTSSDRAQGFPSHSGMSSGITISILSSVLQRSGFSQLSALGAPAVLGKVVPLDTRVST